MTDAAPISLYDQAARLSSIGVGRWEMIAHAIDMTHPNAGEIWECGAWEGGTALWMRDHIGFDSSRAIRAFDTFTGQPSQGADDTHEAGSMAVESFSAVDERLLTNDIDVRPGIMPDSFQGLEHCVISVAHVDVNQYASVKGCLEWLYPRVHSGGWVIIDDYADKNCLGAKRATDEFLSHHPDIRLVGSTNECNPQVYFIKP